MKWTAITLGAAAIAAVLAMPVVAQNYEEGDDPNHGVARLSLINGDVTIRRGDTGEVVAGERNAPLVALDHVLTGPGSRAEIQFDSSNMIRLGPVSEVRLGDLRAGDYLVQIAEGLTTFRVLRETSAYVEISTPTVSIRPAAEGTYRVLVSPDGTTEITVRGGQAEIFTPRGSEILRSGKTMVARGTAADPEFMISNAIPNDDWDRWNHDRDRDLEKTSSNQYTSSSIYGVEDLDPYGRWVYDSPYGWVWVPTVSSSWAPYRVGRWSYINYYGWTWVSGDPWGWAPYHYGNWYSSPYGWAWYPGAINSRYYWRPGLVTFFGWGSGSVSVGLGWNYANVGWVPLAPYEIYRPWYGSRRGVTVVNNITVVNIVDNYRNARVYNGRDGVTCVPSTNFGRSRVTTENYVQVNGNDLRRAGRVDGGIPLEQTRESRRFSDRAPAPEVAKRAERVQERQFATRATTAATSTGSGSRRAAAAQPVTQTPQQPDANSGVRTTGRTGVERTSVDRTDTNAGSRRAAAPDSGSAPALTDRPARAADSSATSTEGWRRFDPGSATQPSRTDRATQPSAPSARSSTSSPSPTVNNATVNNDRGRRQAVEVAPPTYTAPSDSRRSSAPAVTTAPSVPTYTPPASSRREVAPAPTPAPRVEAPRVETRRAEPAPAPAPRVETRRPEPAPQVSAPPQNTSRAAERSAVPSAPPADNGRRSASPSPAPASNGRESGGGERRR